MEVVIDNKVCEAEYGEHILTVAKRNGIDIPTLCNNEVLNGIGSCRLCIVELADGQKTKIVASCLYPVTRRIVVNTESYKIVRIRKTIMKLLLSRNPENEYLNSFARKYGLQPSNLPFTTEKADDCILCGLCVKACEKVGANAISTVSRGIWKKVSTPYDEPSAVCVGCGSCAAVCPTGAIGMEDADGKRTIWGKTFDLIRCERCGQHYAPREYIEFIEKKLGGKIKGNYCSSCRKAMQAEKFVISGGL